MLIFFLSLISAEDYPSLSLDDTYHEVVIPGGSNATYWVQPKLDHSAILILHNMLNINCSKKNTKDTDFVPMGESKFSRPGNITESRYLFQEEDPVLFRISCGGDECAFVITHVHTDPVYHTSSVMGAFSIFVCLFLVILSWTVFCGACRATRKR
ncbi:hypothetical protein GPJ56_008488 [Histomonas meleagridis]|uniref:uncharacterized protein n=1 Tax=Histomonas meleagridis TaxID=135588 RepID=UPI0035593EFE|nr:hypothetical protein GPJ56_008488 [Histomonas meleagridis]KAH0797682.1 hypothetical protein GO595_009311 [Histomonas meleagridis]